MGILVPSNLKREREGEGEEREEKEYMYIEKRGGRVTFMKMQYLNYNTLQTSTTLLLCVALLKLAHLKKS